MARAARTIFEYLLGAFETKEMLTFEDANEMLRSHAPKDPQRHRSYEAEDAAWNKLLA